MDKLDTLKIVIIGHVDHGKSTLIGRLLMDTDSIPEGKIEELERISEELGKDTELAYLVDQLKEEREQNITIDTTQIFFHTDKRNYVIIDAPGHVEFIKNMITGASLAEAAVLMCDVDEGVMEQTRRHAYLINMLGLDNIIVLFNKMDLVGYDEARYRAVKDELIGFLNTLGVTVSHTIPISAREGDNVVIRSSTESKSMGWYDGPTLLEVLDSFTPEKDLTEHPLRFPVQDIYDMDGTDVIVGKVTSGTIKKGEEVTILPDKKHTKVKEIKVFMSDKESASEGENIGLVLDDPYQVKRGEVIVAKSDPVEPTDRFRASIFWMAQEPMLLNKKMTLRCATQEVECSAEKIERRLDSSTLEIIETDAKELRVNEAASVIFKTERPVVVEDFSVIEELGRFIIEQDYCLQGAGVVTE